MSLLLGHAGFAVACAGSGREGLQLLARDRRDVVLLDLHLPDCSGLQLLERLNRSVPRPAVIVMTGFGTVPSVVEAMRLGASDFLEKPVFEEDILAAIDKLVPPGAAPAPEIRQPADGRIAHLVSVIEARITERQALSLAQLARAVGLSPAYLSRLFSEQTGRPLVPYIRDRRIRRAAAALARRREGIEAVARQFGYRYVTGFTRDFRRVLGCSPREFVAALLPDDGELREPELPEDPRG